jgi:hypothetical protein
MPPREPGFHEAQGGAGRLTRHRRQWAHLGDLGERRRWSRPDTTRVSRRGRRSSCCEQDTLAKQVELRAAVHLAFEHLDPVDVALDCTRAPRSMCPGRPPPVAGAERRDRPRGVVAAAVKAPIHQLLDTTAGRLEYRRHRQGRHRHLVGKSPEGSRQPVGRLEHRWVDLGAHGPVERSGCRQTPEAGTDHSAGGCDASAKSADERVEDHVDLASGGLGLG